MKITKTKFKSLLAEAKANLIKANPDTELEKLDAAIKKLTDAYKAMGVTEKYLHEAIKKFGMLNIHASLAQVIFVSGFPNVLSIAKYSSRFKSLYTPLLGGTSEADLVVKKARNLLNKVREYLLAIDAGTLPHNRGSKYDNYSATLDDAYEDMPNYEDLFGSLDFCETPESRTMISPGAYLIDLIKLYLDEITQDTESRKLEDRRPDIFGISGGDNITIDQAGTYKTVPKLQIVNELLQLQLENKEVLKPTEEYSLQDQLAGEAGSPLTYPMNFPVNLANEQIKDILKLFNTNYPELISTIYRQIQNPGDKKNAETSAAYQSLNISQQQYNQVFLNDSTDDTVYYGKDMVENEAHNIKVDTHYRLAMEAGNTAQKAILGTFAKPDENKVTVFEIHPDANSKNWTSTDGNQQRKLKIPQVANRSNFGCAAAASGSLNGVAIASEGGYIDFFHLDLVNWTKPASKADTSLDTGLDIIDMHWINEWLIVITPTEIVSISPKRNGNGKPEFKRVASLTKDNKQGDCTLLGVDFGNNGIFHVYHSSTRSISFYNINHQSGELKYLDFYFTNKALIGLTSLVSKINVEDGKVKDDSYLYVGMPESFRGFSGGIMRYPVKGKLNRLEVDLPTRMLNIHRVDGKGAGFTLGMLEGKDLFNLYSSGAISISGHSPKGTWPEFPGATIHSDALPTVYVTTFLQQTGISFDTLNTLLDTLANAGGSDNIKSNYVNSFINNDNSKLAPMQVDDADQSTIMNFTNDRLIRINKVIRLGMQSGMDYADIDYVLWCVETQWTKSQSTLSDIYADGIKYMAQLKIWMDAYKLNINQAVALIGSANNHQENSDGLNYLQSVYGTSLCNIAEANNTSWDYNKLDDNQNATYWAEFKTALNWTDEDQLVALQTAAVYQNNGSIPQDSKITINTDLLYRLYRMSVLNNISGINNMRFCLLLAYFMPPTELTSSDQNGTPIVFPAFSLEQATNYEGYFEVISRFLTYADWLKHFKLDELKLRFMLMGSSKAIEAGDHFRSNDDDGNYLWAIDEVPPKLWTLAIKPQKAVNFQQKLSRSLQGSLVTANMLSEMESFSALGRLRKVTIERKNFTNQQGAFRTDITYELKPEVDRQQLFNDLAAVGYIDASSGFVLKMPLESLQDIQAYANEHLVDKQYVDADTPLANTVFKNILLRRFLAYISAYQTNNAFSIGLDLLFKQNQVTIDKLAALPLDLLDTEIQSANGIVSVANINAAELRRDLELCGALNGKDVQNHDVYKAMLDYLESSLFNIGVPIPLNIANAVFGDAKYAKTERFLAYHNTVLHKKQIDKNGDAHDLYFSRLATDLIVLFNKSRNASRAIYNEAVSDLLNYSSNTAITDKLYDWSYQLGIGTIKNEDPDLYFSQIQNLFEAQNGNKKISSEYLYYLNELKRLGTTMSALGSLNAHVSNWWVYSYGPGHGSLNPVNPFSIEAFKNSSYLQQFTNRFGDNYGLIEKALLTKPNPALLNNSHPIEVLEAYLRKVAVKSQLPIDPKKPDDSDGIKLILGAISYVTGWSVPEMLQLLQFWYPTEWENQQITPNILANFQAVFDYSDKTGLSIENLTTAGRSYNYDKSTDYDPLVANLLAALKQTYSSEEQWNKVWEPVNIKYEELKRDALVNLFINYCTSQNDDKVLATITNSRLLSEYLCTDVEVSGKVDDSYVEEAMGAVQWYLNRCNSGLELDVAYKNGPEEFDNRWAWMKSFAQWQTNRAVYMFPENYLDPTTITGASPAYQDFVQALQSTNISEETVYQAYTTYLDDFMEVANLKVVSGYIADSEADTSTKTLYLLARTYGTPYTYYIRSCTLTYSSNNVLISSHWEPWQEINSGSLNNCPRATVVAAFGRVFLLWVSFSSVENPKNEGTSNPSKMLQAELKFCTNKLSQNQWNAEQVIRTQLCYNETEVLDNNAAPATPMSLSDVVESDYEIQVSVTDSAIHFANVMTNAGFITSHLQVFSTIANIQGSDFSNPAVGVGPESKPIIKGGIALGTDALGITKVNYASIDIARDNVWDYNAVGAGVFKPYTIEFFILPPSGTGKWNTILRNMANGSLLSFNRTDENGTAVDFFNLKVHADSEPNYPIASIPYETTDSSTWLKVVVSANQAVDGSINVRCKMGKVDRSTFQITNTVYTELTVDKADAGFQFYQLISSNTNRFLLGSQDGTGATTIQSLNVYDQAIPLELFSDDEPAILYPITSRDIGSIAPPSLDLENFNTLNTPYDMSTWTVEQLQSGSNYTDNEALWYDPLGSPSMYTRNTVSTIIVKPTPQENLTYNAAIYTSLSSDPNPFVTTVNTNHSIKMNGWFALNELVSVETALFIVTVNGEPQPLALTIGSDPNNPHQSRFIIRWLDSTLSFRHDYVPLINSKIQSGMTPGQWYQVSLEFTGQSNDATIEVDVHQWDYKKQLLVAVASQSLKITNNVIISTDKAMQVAAIGSQSIFFTSLSIESLEINNPGKAKDDKASALYSSVSQTSKASVMEIADFNAYQQNYDPSVWTVQTLQAGSTSSDPVLEQDPLGNPSLNVKGEVTETVITTVSDETYKAAVYNTLSKDGSNSFVTDVNDSHDIKMGCWVALSEVPEQETPLFIVMGEDTSHIAIEPISVSFLKNPDNADQFLGVIRWPLPASYSHGYITENEDDSKKFVMNPKTWYWISLEYTLDIDNPEELPQTRLATIRVNVCEWNGQAISETAYFLGKIGYGIMAGPDYKVNQVAAIGSNSLYFTSLSIGSQVTDPYNQINYHGTGTSLNTLFNDTPQDVETRQIGRPFTDLFKGVAACQLLTGISDQYLLLPSSPVGTNFTRVSQINSDSLTVINSTGLYYKILRLNSPAAKTLANNFFEYGIEGEKGLLSPYSQSSIESDFSDNWAVNRGVISVAPQDAIDFMAGINRQYYWELFFASSWLIAQTYQNDGQFALAQQWWQYIFDPTKRADPLDDHTNDQYWNFLGLKSENNPILALELGRPPQDEADAELSFGKHKATTDINYLHEAEKVYYNNPDDANAIAALRPIALQRKVVMDYVNNLLEWGDELFTQNTRETIRDAEIRYFEAYDLLGEEPINVGTCKLPQSQTVGKIVAPYLQDPSAFPEFEIIPNNADGTMEYLENTVLKKGFTLFASSGYTANNYIDGEYFAIPINNRFTSMWSTIKDRIYKIENQLDINGNPDYLPLFTPANTGLSSNLSKVAAYTVNDNFASLTGIKVPYVRFRAMMELTRTVLGVATDFASRMQGALERKDEEYLSALLSTQQKTIVDMMTTMKQYNVDSAQDNIQALKYALMNAQDRLNHYTALKQEDWKEGERNKLGADTAATVFFSLAFINEMAASYLSLTTPFRQDTVESHIGSGLNTMAFMNQNIGGKAEFKASHQRMRDDWDLQIELANDDIKQIEQQQAMAQAQYESALQDLATTKTDLLQQQVVVDYKKNKFTKTELYSWMSGELSVLYRKTYQLAYQMALMTQKCFQYELGLTNTYILEDTWNHDYKGLLATQNLASQLIEMEKGYLDNFERRFEIVKTISLKELSDADSANAKQFDILKRTGECDIHLSSELFDQDYPGHYCRQIAAVTVTLPALLGPYTNIHSTLRQVSNTVLLTDNEDGLKYLYGERTDLKVDELPLRINYYSDQQIAISNGIDEAGVFQFSMEDSRYLPFEGTGAISTWKLSIPKEQNLKLLVRDEGNGGNNNKGDEPYDLKDFKLNLSDVIINIRYRALKGSPEFENLVRSKVRPNAYYCMNNQVVDEQTRNRLMIEETLKNTKDGDLLDALETMIKSNFIPRALTLSDINELESSINDLLNNMASGDKQAYSDRFEELKARMNALKDETDAIANANHEIYGTQRVIGTLFTDFKNEYGTEDTFAIESVLTPQVQDLMKKLFNDLAAMRVVNVTAALLRLKKDISNNS